MNQLINAFKKSMYVLPFLVIVIYMLPYFIWGEDSFVYSHDNLDGMVANINFMANNGYLFSSNKTIVEGYMNGLPRICYGTEFNIQYLLYYIFTPYVAYVLNVFIVHVVAVFGTILLLKNYLLPNSSKHVIQLLSLCLGLLPFWYAGGLSIAAQPLVLYALLNIYKGNKKTISLLILIFYCCYSMFFWAGIFFLFAIILFSIALQIINKKINIVFSVTILCFALVYSFTEYRVIGELLFGNTVFHRSSYQQNEALNGIDYFKKIIYSLRYGHYQSLALHQSLLIMLVPLSLYQMYKGNKKSMIILLEVVAVIFTLTFVSSRYFVHVIESSFNQSLPFNFSRINTLLPFTLLLFVSYWMASVNDSVSKKIIPFVLFIQVFICFYASANFRYTIGKHVVHIPQILQYDNSHEVSSYNSFREFYAVDLYREIQSKTYFKNAQPCNVGCAGIQPSQLLYNGISGINGYVNLYPQSYKEKMMRVNENYVNSNLKGNYNLANWGNRCYLYNPLLDDTSKCDTCSFNVNYNDEELKQLNCKFIFSAFELKSANLFLVDCVSNKQRKIFVYQLQ